MCIRDSIHTVDGAILQNRYGKAVIRSHDIGLISLPTGEIVMADPTLRFEIADFKRKAFQQKVSPGIFSGTSSVKKIRGAPIEK